MDAVGLVGVADKAHVGEVTFKFGDHDFHLRRHEVRMHLAAVVLEIAPELGVDGHPAAIGARAEEMLSRKVDSGEVWNRYTMLPVP